MIKRLRSLTIFVVISFAYYYFTTLFLEKKHNELFLYGTITIVCTLVFGIYKQTFEDDDTSFEKIVRSIIMGMTFFYPLFPIVKARGFTTVFHIGGDEETIYKYNCAIAIIYATGLAYLFDIGLKHINIVLGKKIKDKIYTFIFAIYGVFSAIFKGLSESKPFLKQLEKINLEGFTIFRTINKSYKKDDLELFTTIIFIFIVIYFGTILFNRAEKEKERNKTNQI
jgi:hypothetical protein